MSGPELYVTRFSAWAPGVENSGEWDEWARGRREIASGGKGPDITFTDSLFRRRLSTISRMTVQVVHDLLPVKENTRMLFVSFWGELSRQYQINKMLIEEKALTPAVFSLSVFNAPAALASIALGLKGGYSALYPGNNSFAAGLAAAEAALSEAALSEDALSEDALSEAASPDATGELIFVYADEEAPPEYRSFFQSDHVPGGQTPSVAFAVLLTREPQPGGECREGTPLAPQPSGECREGSPLAPQSSSIPLSQLKGTNSPLEFLRRLLLRGKIHVLS